MANPQRVELKNGEENGTKKYVTIIEDDSDSEDYDLPHNLPDLISSETNARANEPKPEPDTLVPEHFPIAPNKIENEANHQEPETDASDCEESEAEKIEAINEQSEPSIAELDPFEIMNEETVKELDEAFNIFDFDGDGLITHNDLQKIFIALDVEKSDREITSMLAEGSKPLDFEGFVKLIGTRVAELDSEDVLVEALSKWDYDKSGYIPLPRFRDDLMNKGECFTEQEVRFALEKAPIIKKRGVKMIEYPTFCNSIGGMRKKFF